MSVVETFLTPQTDQVVHLPVDRVRPSPDNPRADVGNVTGLADSIAANGLVQPIVVYPADDDGTHEIVAGHRRYAAHLHLQALLADAGHRQRLRELFGDARVEQLQSATIACLVRERPADEAATTAARIVENVQRADLTVADEARAYRALSGLGWSQRTIADAVGVHQSHVSKRTALSTLPEDLLTAVNDGQVTVEQGLAWIYLQRKGPDGMAAQLLADWRAGQSHAMGIRLDNAVSRVKTDEKRTKAMAKAQAAAEAGDGPPVALDLDATNGGILYSALRARGMSLLRDTTLRDVDREQLQADGTLGVVVDHTGALVEVCTDVARYEAPPEPTDDRDGAPAVGLSATYRRWADAAEKRTRFLEGALAAGDLPAPPAHTALIRLLCDQVLDASTADVVKLAALAAGIDCTGSATRVKARIRETLDVSRPPNTVIEQACKVAHALRLARIDRSLSHYSEPDERDRAHLADLEAAGYELSDVEREWLDSDREGDTE